MPVRVVLADDHEILRQGLKEMFENHDDYTVVGEATDGTSAVEKVKELAPDVILLDVGMPNLNGVEAARQIVAGKTKTRVIVLSIHTSRQFISEMFKAGASAYLHKNCTFDEILRAIDAVMSDRTYLSPEIAGKVMDDYVGRLSGEARTGAGLLTDRERQVLQLIAEGYSAKQAAMKLQLSAKTVEGYRRQIMDKLDIHSVAELTKFALAEGLTFLEP